jgi:signal transduction histidine kinase
MSRTGVSETQSPPARVGTVTVTTVAVLLACGGAAAGLVAHAPAGSGQIMLALAEVVFVFAGAVIALARPDNRVGWVLLAGAIAWGVGDGLYEWAYRGIVAAPGSVAGASGLAVAGFTVRGLGWLVIALAVPALFPDGHLAGPRWRWLGWTIGATVLANTVGGALAPDIESTDLHAVGWHNPLPVPAVVGRLGDTAAALSLPLLAICFGSVVVAMVVRSRRGNPAMRRQLLLFSAAVALPVVVIPPAFATGSPSWVFVASVLPIPVAAAVAIFTGGLFDLATVANRSLVWTALTVAVVGIYAVIVGGTGEVLRGAHSAVVPWLAVAAVAVSFAPLRSGLQSAVNRLTYGRWREPYDVLAALGQRIDAAVDTDRLADDVVAELHASLGLREVALLDSAGTVVAGAQPGPEAVPLTAYGRTVGTLCFAEPATALRPADRRLLDDLAGQLSSLLHARALTDDLRRARERLVRAREEERRRLRRDLHDDLGPALAGMMLKVDTALARVEPDPKAAQQDLIVLRSDIQATVGDIRRLVEGLRPPAIDELGLAAALTQAVNRLLVGAALKAEIAVQPLAGLPAAVEVAAYRIVTEAVTNVVRHADAHCCAVAVSEVDGNVVVRVCDDGNGLKSPEHGHGHGMDTMRERAEELGGTLSIVDGNGVTVTAVLPVGGFLRNGGPA